MSHFVVWMDSENARLFEYLPGKMEQHQMARHEADHHTHSKRDIPKDSEHFFHQICERLTGATEVLLLGPVLARDHFQAHLANHHHADLAKKVIGSEVLDHPTDPQIEAFARKFFNAHNLFL